VLTIGIDIDGIVADCLSAWLATYNQRFDDTVSAEDVTDYNLRKVAKKTHGREDVFSILATPGFFGGLLPIPGAVEGVTGLRAGGHDVVLVTNRPLHAAQETEDWVARHLGTGLEIAFVRQKERLSLDVLFDDSSDVLRDYYIEWPQARIATIAYPYNVGAERWAHVVGHCSAPAAAWLHFVDWIEALK
jgi:5'(3')-deoxyribonucleotidase